VRQPNHFTIYRTAVALSLILCAAVVALGVVRVEGAVTQIELGEFVTPRVLDFESTPTGNVGGTDSLFADFGISSVEYTGYRMADRFDNYANVSRALWVNEGGLVVCKAGMSGFADHDLSYTLNLADLHQRIGIGVNDHDGQVNFDFLSSGSTVDSFVIDRTGTPGLAMFYLESSKSFDGVKITASMGGRDPAGFAIDNMTLDSVPEPATHALVFREDGSGKGFWGRFTNYIPGWDHVGLSYDGKIYESHPHDEGLWYDPDTQDYVRLTFDDGVQVQHTDGSFKHHEYTSQSGDVTIGEVQISPELAAGLASQINTRLDSKFRDIGDKFAGNRSLNDVLVGRDRMAVWFNPIVDSRRYHAQTEAGAGSLLA